MYRSRLVISFNVISWNNRGSLYLPLSLHSAALPSHTVPAAFTHTTYLRHLHSPRQLPHIAIILPRVSPTAFVTHFCGRYPWLQDTWRYHKYNPEGKSVFLCLLSYSCATAFMQYNTVTLTTPPSLHLGLEADLHYTASPTQPQYVPKASQPKTQRADGVGVSHSLSIRKVSGSIPDQSNVFSLLCRISTTLTIHFSAVWVSRVSPSVTHFPVHTYASIKIT